MTKVAYDKAYYLKNADKIKEQRRQHRQRNKQKINASDKKYRLRNKLKLNNYVKTRRKNDLNFRLMGNLRSRVRSVIKGIDKSTTTLKLVSCSLEQLKQHLEPQFVEGMNWNNYGEWHIDHIMPCASFNLMLEDEQKKCFHYSNLQPLWALDNIKKSNKLPWNLCESSSKL